MSPATDARLRRTFVELADTLVAEFDVIEFLEMLSTRCVEVLDVDSAGLLLADADGALTVVAASTERTRALELLQLQDDEGPCLDAYRSGEAVQSADLGTDTAGARWPRFAPAALAAGHAAVLALPMRLRDESVGAINLFRDEPGPLEGNTVALAQALADVATIGILHERAIRRQEVVAEQLQLALSSRVSVEQAKGVLAARLDIDVDEAFERLRRYARRTNSKLAAVAAAVVSGTADVDEIARGTGR